MPKLIGRIAALCAPILVIIILLGQSSNQSGVVSAQQPTFQPTETAVPIITPTPAPILPPMDLPVVDWSDLSVHKQAMKPQFANDVDGFADANRYLIEAKVTLSPDAVITGALRLRFVNRSGEALEELVFRLYANTPALGGRMTVRHVEVNGEIIEPSLSNLRSVMGVPLSKPLAPNEVAEIRLDFTTIMTRGLDTSYGRFGYVNNVISSTAWYPTLSVYEPGIGWWVDLPSPQGDPAYSETGLYDVRLTLPPDFTVGMSGTIIDTRKNEDGTITYRDVTGPMRDHAFLASPRYAIDTVEVDGTRINLLHYKDKRNDPANGTDVAAKYSLQSLEIFNDTFGEYPYAELDVTQNPTPSGVEFPGIIQIAEKAWVQGNNYLETVIAHEIGHQWFYSIIGNNQVTLPWVDESLTSYTEFVYFRAAYPDDPKRGDDYVNAFQNRYTMYLSRGLPDLALNLPVRNYLGFSYGAIIYTKGPLFLVALERELGRETVYKALARYFERMKYKVATSQDVQSAFEEASGRDLTDIFNKWVYGRES